MQRSWQADSATVVGFRTGAFGLQILSVNGEEYFRRRPWRGKTSFDFVIPGSGTKAVLDVKPSFMNRFGHLQLRVGGRPIVEDSEIIACKGCAGPDLRATTPFERVVARPCRQRRPMSNGAI
jgi:hypothetical protein